MMMLNNAWRRIRVMVMVMVMMLITNAVCCF